jgi:hypothetical protein
MEKAVVKGSTGNEPRVAFVTTSLSLDPPDREMHPVWQCYARCNDNQIWRYGKEDMAESEAFCISCRGTS